MARVIGQTIPPALETAFGDLLINASPATGAGRIIKADPRLSAREPASTGGTLGYFASSTAKWFRRNWQYAVSQTALREFAFARESDVLAADFPPAYWYPAAQVEDLTELARPAWVLPSRGRMDPAYWDAAHRPGNCPMVRINDTYLTPTGAGTEERPAPGWAGKVEDRVFGDIYQAQRRLMFALPLVHTPNTSRPIALRITAAIEAHASHRGSAAWFILVSRPYWYNTAGGSASAPQEVLTDWTDAQVVPFVLPTEGAGPWSFTHEVCITRNAELGGHLDFFTPYNRLWVRVATPPSRGRYFMRNDWVSVTVTSSVQVFMGRGPHD